MKPLFPRHILALISLMVFVLTGLTVAQGYAWCFGENGHAALEQAKSKTCAPAPQQQLPDCDGEQSISLSFDQNCCGPCLDIPNSFDLISKRLNNHDKVQIQLDLPITLQSFSSHVFYGTDLVQLLPQPPPRENQRLLAHRTVVLLI